MDEKQLSAFLENGGSITKVEPHIGEEVKHNSRYKYKQLRPDVLSTKEYLWGTGKHTKGGHTMSWGEPFHPFEIKVIRRFIDEYLECAATEKAIGQLRQEVNQEREKNGMGPRSLSSISGKFWGDRAKLRRRKGLSDKKKRKYIPPPTPAPVTIPKATNDLEDILAMIDLIKEKFVQMHSKLAGMEKVVQAVVELGKGV